MPRFLATAAPLAVIAFGGIGLASAQSSSSPFATQKKQQAWEQPAPTPAQPAPKAVPQPYAPAIQGPANEGPAYPAPTYQPQPLQQVAPVYTPPASFDQTYTVPARTLPQPSAQPASGVYNPPAASGAYYPGRGPSARMAAPQYAQQATPQSYPAPQKPQDWKDRFGLRNIVTLLKGGVRTGAALSYRDVPPNQIGAEDGYGEDFVVDADVEFEASAITQGGLEYGVNLGARAQYDPYRRGFGGRLPDCPPTVAGCSPTGTTSLRGHTSQFYQFGEDTAKDAQFAVESAHLFLRSAYGDVTIGRDDGAAYLFSLGAPTLMAVNASNSPVDYTGLDSVKTLNDASGFSEKITYTSPRLLGDRIGVGVQFGVSYALDADSCGVDYCPDRNVDGVIRPELEDVMEAGLALDRTFTNGLSVEGTLSYATASETSGLAGLDDLQSYGAGLEFGYGDFVLGGSWLKSNNGLLDGDYSAYDAGITWKPGALGFSFAYGHAEDDNVGLESDQGTFGVSYEFDKFTLGTGVQYVDRSVTGLIPLGAGVFEAGPLDQKATSVFIEGGFKF